LIFGNPTGKAIRYWVTSTGAGRGGWIVAAVGLDKGKEVSFPHYRTGIATKAEAKRLADQLNESLRSGNPAQSVGTHKGVEMFFEGISYNAPSLKLWGYSTDLALSRAIDRKLKAAEKKRSGNPWVGAGNYPTRAQAEAHKKHLESAGKKVRIIVSAKGTPSENYGVVVMNPTKRELQRAARDRAARIRGARLNPPRGEFKTIPQLLRDCEKLRAALRYRMGNKAATPAQIKALEKKSMQLGAQMSAMRKAGQEYAPEVAGQRYRTFSAQYSALDDESQKVFAELERARRSRNPRAVVSFDPSVQKYLATVYHQSLEILFRLEKRNGRRVPLCASRLETLRAAAVIIIRTPRPPSAKSQWRSPAGFAAILPDWIRRSTYSNRFTGAIRAR